VTVRITRSGATATGVSASRVRRGGVGGEGMSSEAAPPPPVVAEHPASAPAEANIANSRRVCTVERLSFARR
jgi:hypothetical protein